MIKNNTNLDRYITTNELANLIRCKPNTIAKWRITKQEVIPYIKINGRILYPESSVSEWLLTKTIK